MLQTQGQLETLKVYLENLILLETTLMGFGVRMIHSV
jgi:hypothetical protein